MTAGHYLQLSEPQFRMLDAANRGWLYPCGHGKRIAVVLERLGLVKIVKSPRCRLYMRVEITEDGVVELKHPAHKALRRRCMMFDVREHKWWSR